ncbi:hypothetical protein [Williamsia sp.]|uniref:hypothetical protein n=1 Tax=Williamsia sp. TaxID=1872085 RepID=UPI001A277D60|nr:hypothetical protein [Williamsia sp.]MBJ7291705.1 hypothetical protein [Williamsia sp.]
MRRSIIGSVCAGLVVAGAAVAMNPGVAAADDDIDIAGYEASIVDASGGIQPIGSQFGSKLRIDLLVDEVGSVRPACKLTVSPDGNDLAKPVYSATLVTKKGPASDEYNATKTTRALEPGTYYAVTRCNGQGDVRTTPFQIVDAPALVISGTATCYQGNQEGGKPEFIRPVGLDLVQGDKINSVRLTSTTVDGRKASKFTYKSYGAGPFTATIKCGGTARNPGRVFTYPEPVTAPSSGICLVAD